MQRAITSSAAAYPAASYSLLPPLTSATRTVVCPLESIVPTLAEKYHGDDEIVRTRWRACVAETRPVSSNSDPCRRAATIGKNSRRIYTLLTSIGNTTRVICACSRKGINMEQGSRSEEHTSELQSRLHLVCRLLLEKKKK